MRFVLVLTALVFTATSAMAQTADNPLGLAEGDEIRVRQPDQSEMVAGTVLAVDRNQFSYSIEDETGPLTLPYAQVDTIDVRRRIPRQSAILGGTWGGFLGAALGTISGPFLATTIGMDTGPAIATTTAVGGISGGLLGASVGALLVPARWYRHILR